jgi:hypothetical protein
VLVDIQVPVAPEDRYKTAFSTPDGHFGYKRMRSGLKPTPSAFQRMTNNVLSEFMGTKCLVYMDDILIMGETLNI